MEFASKSVITETAVLMVMIAIIFQLGDVHCSGLETQNVIWNVITSSVCLITTIATIQQYAIQVAKTL